MFESERANFPITFAPYHLHPQWFWSQSLFHASGQTFGCLFSRNFPWGKWASQLGGNGKVRWLSKQLEQLQKKWKTLLWERPCSTGLTPELDIHAGQACVQKSGINHLRWCSVFSLARCDSKEARKRTDQPLRLTPLLLVSVFSERRRRNGKEFKGQRVPCYPPLPSRRSGTSM